MPNRPTERRNLHTYHRGKRVDLVQLAYDLKNLRAHSIKTAQMCDNILLSIGEPIKPTKPPNGKESRIL